jgi:hypothetical protein
LAPLLAVPQVLVSAHGNSLRALLMELDGVSPEAIPLVTLPNALPLVYDLDAALQVILQDGARAPLRGRYLVGDGDALVLPALASPRPTAAKKRPSSGVASAHPRAYPPPAPTSARKRFFGKKVRPSEVRGISEGRGTKF